MISDNITVLVINNATIIDLTNYYQHIGFGLTAVITNCIILFILIRNKSLLKKSPFIFVLALGDTFEGIALTIAGFVRIVRWADGTIDLPVHPAYCLQTVVGFFLLGNQLPAAMFVLIGAERFLAVYYFSWYFNKWTNRLAWLITAVASATALTSVLIAWLIANQLPTDYVISNRCNIADTVNKYYLIYNYGAAILGGISAVVASVVALALFHRRRRALFGGDCYADTSSLRSHVRSQLHVTKVLLSTATVDMVLVVLPTFVLFFCLGFRMSELNDVAGSALRIISARSALNILVYVLVNKEFRSAASKAFFMSKLRCRSCFKTNNRVASLPPGVAMSQFLK